MSLLLVPTPIGNLKDMTYRSVEALEEADLILCEDTRHSGHLLKHYQISKPKLAFHAHNEHRLLPEIIHRLKNNDNVCYISDAGMPGISDPGFSLVRACVEEGIEVDVLPGATSSITALVASGLPCDRFYFEGFLPIKKGRQTRLEYLSKLEETIILFESPHKILKTLKDLSEKLGGETPACLARELTKMHQEYIRSTLQEITEELSARNFIKGEIVLVIDNRN